MIPNVFNPCHARTWLLVITGIPSVASKSAISPAERIAVQLMKHASATTPAAAERTCSAIASGAIRAISPLVSTPRQLPPVTTMPLSARNEISR